jgi:hypothetical protein
MPSALRQGFFMQLFWMLLAAFGALAGPGFFACQNASRSADDFTFFAFLAGATVAFACAHYALVRQRSPVRRAVLVAIGVIALLIVAIPVGAVISFAGCGHFHI